MRVSLFKSIKDEILPKPTQSMRNFSLFNIQVKNENIQEIIHIGWALVNHPNNIVNDLGTDRPDDAPKP